VLDLEAAAGQAPLLSVFGGKITTYRRLAEHALEKLAPFFDTAGRSWTATETLPGGDVPDLDIARFLATLKAQYPFLPPDLAGRLGRSYGTRARLILRGADGLADLGEDFGGGLHRAELDYLAAEEWARTEEDVLWRRSKLGLHVPPGTAEKIAAYFAANAVRAAAPAVAAPVGEGTA
jgi:glycerol-3-phosphate dehydrogenase